MVKKIFIQDEASVLVNIANLASGVYLVDVSGENFQSVQKLEIRR